MVHFMLYNQIRCNMFFVKLCYVSLLLIHHGCGVIQFDVSEDTPMKYKLHHGLILQSFNNDYLKCEQETKMSYAAVSAGLHSIIIENNMTVSDALGCFMFCITKTTGLINEEHVLNMIALKRYVIVYQATLRPYPRIRAILSVMIACYVKMKSPKRQSHCDLFRNILKCVEMYEKVYGPYTVRPK